MKVFFDANIILDRFDTARPMHKFSMTCYEYLLINAKIYTSCDLITTVYYVNAKNNSQQALLNIQALNKTLEIIKFSNNEIEKTCTLMLEDSDYTDLEDTLQYIMAKKENCDLIISNDKNFVSKDIELLTSEEFCRKEGIV